MFSTLLPDLTAPQLLAASPNGNLEVILSFDEALDSNLSGASFSISNGPAITKALLSSNGLDIALSLATALDSGKLYQVNVSGVKDCPGNVLGTGNANIVIPAIPSYRQVVINEVMADPSPSQGLPNAEFIEIFNASNSIFNTDSWKISDGSSEGTLPNQILMPGEFLIISSVASSSSFSSFGTVISTSLPGLNNGGETLQLLDGNGVLIDRLDYNLAYYQNPLKEDGGWSLEQINPLTNCIGKTNFSASNNTNGGTPGSINSVFDTLPDLVAPQLLSASVRGVDTILLVFDERLDSTSIINGTYTLSGGTSILFAEPSFPEYETVRLVLANPLDSGKIDTIRIQNVFDCEGNPIGMGAEAELVVPGIAKYRDVVINEIYADPSPSFGLPDAEFIEIYNASDQVFDLSRWELGRSFNGIKP